MNYQSALNALQMAKVEHVAYTPVHWVSPILSCICAAASRSRLVQNEFKFVGDAGKYAVTNGLTEVIAGNYRPFDVEGQQGVTYSRLAQLQHPHEVEASNSIISDLLHARLGSGKAASMLVQVVGELHDNVVSHAGGLGYSCSQTYQANDDDGKRIELGVVDIGCGMLRNVQRVVPSIDTDDDAIRWCLKKGNTASEGQDPWAQRLPEDATSSPIPGPVFRDERGNHHVGYGLYHLRRLIRYFQGNMWIWSGEAQIIMEGGELRTIPHGSGAWQGVAIEFEITVPDNWGSKEDPELPKELSDLAKRLGL